MALDRRMTRPPPLFHWFVAGEIDMATAPEFRSGLLEAIAKTRDELVLDCTSLTFLDCAGVGVLVEAQRLLASQGRQLQIVNLARTPRRVLNLLGLSDVVGVEPEPRPIPTRIAP